jgi:hypothetical protein
MLIQTTRIAALAVALALCAAPASALVITGAYSGTVVDGHAQGAFGYATRTDVAGMTVTGSFTYDLANATACANSPWFACFVLPGDMTVVQTLNGVSETFTASAPPPGSPSYNAGLGGVAHDRLTVETIELAVRSALGTPASVFEQREIYLGANLPGGRTWPDYLADGAPTWNGAVSSGGFGGVQIPNLTARINETIIYQLTGGDYTKDVRFRFELDHLTMGPGPTPVPEPDSWLMLVTGFGFAGALMRKRRRVAFRR